MHNGSAVQLEKAVSDSAASRGAEWLTDDNLEKLYERFERIQDRFDDDFNRFRTEVNDRFDKVQAAHERQTESLDSIKVAMARIEGQGIDKRVAALEKRQRSIMWIVAMIAGGIGAGASAALDAIKAVFK